MTTLTRERRLKFQAIIREEVYKYYGAYMDESAVVEFANRLNDAAASRTERKTDETNGDYVVQADRKIDVILNLEKQANEKEAAGEAWRGREFLVGSEYLKYGDWWHKKTGLEMYGNRGKAKINTEWMRSFKVWYEYNVTLASLDQAYEAEKWRTISKTSQLTDTAIAIQAAPVVENKKADLPTYQPEDESQFVPAPEKK